MPDAGHSPFPAPLPARPGALWMGFGVDLRDFLRFVRNPQPRRSLPRPAASYWRAELLGGIAPKRMLCWLLLLWGINLLVLGPLAAGAAAATGSENRLPLFELSWFRVIIWAPFAEEMLLRFGLRRPGLALWLMPILIVGIFTVREPVGALLALLALFGAGAVLTMFDYHWPRPRMRRYLQIFPVVFHLVTLTFAFLHLANFRLGGWLLLGLLPLLVLPQWATGLVLGWLRVRFGIGASMLMHGMFNAGPMALIWAIQRYAPGWLG